MTSQGCRGQHERSGKIWPPPRPLRRQPCQVSPIYSSVDLRSQPTRITSILPHLTPLSALTGCQALIFSCASPPQVAFRSVVATGAGISDGAARQPRVRCTSSRRLSITYSTRCEQNGKTRSRCVQLCGARAFDVRDAVTCLLCAQVLS